ncbi:P pilus assembly protein chaperone PapD-like protein [Caballeronia temeraria]|uniref:P pilus assembly protein chaperone PapD-like protein n=1 Tax=Caballeronia temeraria TaxID=1777137 RepID=A0A157Z4B0_9BURK|nr:molecular chaperone [Caballeronia temeraria]SAK39847.1 P pilus assembly protein chaperone PapD-like protein [Caballeronia temeraria]
MTTLLPRACAVFLFLQCCASFAASLQISPVTIQLTGAENGKVINLSNEGDEPIHAQVRTFVWDQDDEKDKLTPTREIIASPPIAEVPAGGTQVIRVIRASMAPVPQERAYRLLIDELPPEGAPAGSNVQFRFRYSVPLFISSAGEMEKPKLQWSIVEKNGKPYLRVMNSGEVHAQLSAVTLRSDATTIPVSPGLLGYVLPGRMRAWMLPDTARALHGKPADVAATVNGAPVTGRLGEGSGP